MERVARLLADVGVPDRWRMVGGIRERVAAMLLDHARRVGAEAFRAAAERLVEAILEEVQR